MWESAERDFQDDGRPIDTVNNFKYLGWVLTVGDDNWLVVVGNLKKAQNSWARLTRILGWEGSKPRVSGMFFKAVVQGVLLFGSETWVLTPCMGRDLGSFQHRVAQRIMERHPRQREEGGWEYPPLVATMEEAGSEEIGVYILKRYNMVAQYIVTQPNLDLCKRLVRMQGDWVYWRCWEQEGLHLADGMEQAVAAENGEDKRGGEEADLEEMTEKN